MTDTKIVKSQSPKSTSRAQETGVGFPRARQDREVEAARSAGIRRQ